MKLIHVKTARAIWLLEIMDLNPRGKNIAEELVEWVKDEYHFSVAPDPQNLPRAPKDQEGLVFERGTFQAREETFIDVKLTIFSDGLVVDTWSSTSDADRFAEDLLKECCSRIRLVI